MWCGVVVWCGVAWWCGEFWKKCGGGENKTIKLTGFCKKMNINNDGGFTMV